MRTWVRCRKCEARRVLARHPDHYLRPPKCQSCGARDYRPVKNYPRELCGCTGYHFMHRKGSRHCDHHPQGLYHQGLRQGGLSADELEDLKLEGPGKVSDTCPF